MTPEEKAATALVSAKAVSKVNDVVEGVSGVVRSRFRRGLAPLGAAALLPMQAVDLTHSGVHRVIRHSAKFSGDATAEVLRTVSDPAAPSVAESSAGLAGVAVLGAAFGDSVPDSLGPDMTIHAPDEVGAATTAVVFVHGLGGHEQQWGVDYALVCAAQDAVPLFVRYTSGKAIDDNARQLGDVLGELVTQWPGERLTSIVLVGHSMGGLVATRAIQLAQTESVWMPLLTHVVTLGSPLGGAPLERFADATLDAIISHSEVAAPIAELGHGRSIGIKDLGPGVAEPLPAHISHVAVVAAVGATPAAPTSRIIGDGIVPTASARGRHPDHPGLTVVELVRSHHLSLLNHPGVSELLATIVAGR